MINIPNIYIILTVFVYIISCCIIYMIVKDIANYRLDKKVNEIKNDFEIRILEQLDSVKLDKEISKIEILYMKEKLKKRPYIKVFNIVLRDFNTNKENYKYTRKYMKYFEDVITEYVKKIRKKDDILKTYLCTAIGEYGISNYEISEFLLSCINTKSIYLRYASLEALSKIGKINTFITGIEYVSRESQYINIKVFTDIIDQFSGDKIELDNYLINNFKNFEESFQKAIVEHFKNNKTNFVAEKMLNYLNDNLSKEVNISIIKYFSIIKYEKAKEKIIDILNNGEWEYKAICASALKNYCCQESKKALIENIYHENWYVRYNSAIALLEFEDDRLIDYILSKKDKYAKDILFYAMFIKNKISYEKYMEKIRKV